MPCTLEWHSGDMPCNSLRLSIGECPVVCTEQCAYRKNPHSNLNCIHRCCPRCNCLDNGTIFSLECPIHTRCTHTRGQSKIRHIGTNPLQRTFHDRYTQCHFSYSKYQSNSSPRRMVSHNPSHRCTHSACHIHHAHSTLMHRLRWSHCTSNTGIDLLLHNRQCRHNDLG